MEDKRKSKLIAQAQAAKIASRQVAQLTNQQRRQILLTMATALQDNSEEIFFQNNIDIEAARQAKLNPALIDRLTLNQGRLAEMVKSVKEIADQPDFLNEVIADWRRPNGLHIQKVRVPLGVVGIIYESRPNVTIDAAALAIKSGNAVILRGGSEAINSNRALVKTIIPAATQQGLPAGSIEFIEETDREIIYQMVRLDDFIDLIIPRGNAEMIKTIRQQATVPVLAHGQGLCHTYVDKDADIAMAKNISFNAKCQRPGVCNAMETLLVHKDIAKKFLPGICEMYQQAGVEIRGCPITQSIVSFARAATEADWETEYLDLIISIRVVDSLEEAIEHINRYGSGHSEAIITENKAAAEKFLREVEAAAVFHNASTRLHDGGVFGLGAEIGISTQKLHARGTMGAKELTTTKYLVRGTGQIR